MRLNDRLKAGLAEIERTGPYSNYWACRAVLADENHVDEVLVIANAEFDRRFGIMERVQPVRRLDVGLIETFEVSPNALRPSFARRLYDAGESYMGGQDYALVFPDNHWVACRVGNLLDFVGPFADGRVAQDAIDVIPGSTTGDESFSPSLGADDLRWCIYDD